MHLRTLGAGVSFQFSPAVAAFARSSCPPGADAEVHPKRPQFVQLRYYAIHMSETRLSIFLLLAASFANGSFLKLIDDLNDVHGLRKYKNHSVILAIIAAIIGSLIIIFYPDMFIILFAVSIALLLAGKVDNLAFLVGLGITSLILTSGFLAGLVSLADKLLSFWFYLGVLIVVALALIDEIGNDMMDNRLGRGIFYYFFRYRFSLKVGLPILAIFTYQYIFIGLWEVVALWSFDLGYFLVEFLVAKKVEDPGSLHKPCPSTVTLNQRGRSPY